MKLLKSRFIVSFFTSFLLICHTHADRMMGFPTVGFFEQQSREFGAHLSIPDFPVSIGELQMLEEKLLEELTLIGDSIAVLTEDELTFENTFRFMDVQMHHLYRQLLPVNIVMNTFPNRDLREAASDTMRKFSEARIQQSFREDVFVNLQAFADLQPILLPEDRRLMEEILTSYQRMGFHLPKEERDTVQELFTNLRNLGSDFSKNIREAEETLIFSASELAGLSASFLDSIRIAEDQYEINTGVSHHTSQVMMHAESESIRKAVSMARLNRTRDINLELLQQMVRKRSELAGKLGFATWADYRMETAMADDGDQAVEFLEKLRESLEARFAAERAHLTSLKRAHTMNNEAVLHSWDVSFYQERDRKLHYELDSEQMREYFPYERVLGGMFGIFAFVFGIEITEIENPTPWDPDVSLYAVSDSETGRPLGLMYIDPFPREGKYNHFAMFTIIGGIELPDGTWQRPTVALVCNFPPPEADRPSLLTFSDVRTLFHEFGHALHSLLSESRHGWFWGTSVPRDFVEVPSQLLEYWLEEPAILDLFAAHWMDPRKRFPETWVHRIREARIAHAGMHYTRQVALGLMDLHLHHQTDVEAIVENLVEETNAIAARVAIPYPQDTAFVTGFGHLNGYDAAYYGYAWADVIAADMAGVFREAPERFLDRTVGKRFREAVLASGNARDVNESVLDFLGREPSFEALIRSLQLVTDTSSDSSIVELHEDLDSPL